MHQEIPVTTQNPGAKMLEDSARIKKFILKWIFLPFVFFVLFEHFATILKLAWKPTYFLDSLRIYLTEPFFKWCGEWVAYFSGFIELLRLNELLDTVWVLFKALGNLILSFKEFIVGYMKVIQEYEWTTGSIILGTCILSGLIGSLIYIYRGAVYKFAVNCKNLLCRRRNERNT